MGKYRVAQNEVCCDTGFASKPITIILFCKQPITIINLCKQTKPWCHDQLHSGPLCMKFWKYDINNVSGCFSSWDIEQIVMRAEKWVIRVGGKVVRSPSTAISNMIDWYYSNNTALRVLPYWTCWNQISKYLKITGMKNLSITKL